MTTRLSVPPQSSPCIRGGCPQGQEEAANRPEHACPPVGGVGDRAPLDADVEQHRLVLSLQAFEGGHGMLTTVHRGALLSYQSPRLALSALQGISQTSYKYK